MLQKAMQQNCCYPTPLRGQKYVSFLLYSNQILVKLLLYKKEKMSPPYSDGQGYFADDALNRHGHNSHKCMSPCAFDK